jgi:hypothetical protein
MGKTILACIYARYIFVLFVCLFVYSHTSNFSAIWWLSPLPVSREGSSSCHTYCNMGPWFIRSHPKDRHPSPTVGFEPPTQGSSDLCARRSNHCAFRAVDISLKIFFSRLLSKTIFNFYVVQNQV